jgi:TPR repeat protein
MSKQPVLWSSLVLISLMGFGCSTSQDAEPSINKTFDAAPRVGKERTVERKTWWPWSDNKETPEEKKAREKLEDANSAMLKSAKDGDAKAQLFVGGLYYRSQPPNLHEAAVWFAKAAEQGNPNGMFSYAVCLDKEAMTRQDKDAKLEEEILYWYEQAANANPPVIEAQYNLGVHLEQHGNLSKACQYYQMAASNKNVDAMYRAGLCLLNDALPEHDATRGFDYLMKAAQRGHARSMLKLADCYQAGLGTERSYEDMMRWLWMAADGDNADPEAQAKVAFCYTKGMGVKSDKTMAFKWYKLAATRNYPPAMLELGNCYMRGTGTDQDPAMAVSWFEKAVRAGEPGGWYALGVASVEGIGMAKDEAKAADLFRKAAEKGIAPAMFNLAVFYEEGRGVKQDMQTALKLYEQAGRNNVPDAWIELASIYLEGRNGVAKDRAKAKAYLDIALRYDGSDARARVMLEDHKLE